MKSMLIAAVTVGAAIAGLLLYAERRSRSSNKVLEAAEDTYQTMNKGIGSMERPAYHAMG
jgi:hypothetical protein